MLKGTEGIVDAPEDPGISTTARPYLVVWRTKRCRYKSQVGR
jgi:hypothetical protein